MKKIIAIMLCIVFIKTLTAQDYRAQDKNYIGWYTTNATVKFHKKWSGYIEYQWRRNDFGKTWQQSLLRMGINYHLNPNAFIRVGYAWAETYPYGDHAVNSFGKEFTEHRMYESIVTNSKVGNRVLLTNRYMLEQRWLDKFIQDTTTKVVSKDGYSFVNRIRYMGRIDIPLIGNTLEKKEPYVAAYDEILIGFGKNVKENILDQNRIGALVGFKINDNIKVEGGYFNQILQLGREINGKNLYQYNQGFIANVVMNFDATKK